MQQTLSIKQLRTVISAVMVSLSALLAMLVYALLVNEQDLLESEEQRYQSYLLADELRQSSDDLTRLARTYAITGDPRYEAQYWDVLAIRNGEKKRPEHYERIYWDFAAANALVSPDSKQQISLNQLMRNSGFSQNELNKLEEANRRSDTLVHTETVAMNAVKGLFDDGSGNFTRRAKPDFTLAQKIMHNQEYHNEKSNIMSPINDFFIALDQRTQALVESKISKNSILFNLLIIVCLLLWGATLYLFWALNRVVLQPLGCEPGELIEIARNISEGDFSTPLENKKTSSGAYAAIIDMLVTLQKTIAEINSVMKALAEGDLKQRIHSDLPGEFNQLKNNINYSIEHFSTTVNDLDKIMLSMKNGDFEYRLENELIGDFQYIQANANDSLKGIKAIFGEVTLVMNKVANNNISSRITLDMPGDFNGLKIAINHSIYELNQTLNDISLSSSQVATASLQMEESVSQISYGALQQQLSISKIATSVHKSTKAISKVAENTTQACDSAADTLSIVERGKNQVMVMLEAINQVAANSEEIQNITEAVSGIARETNMLALNAAIEAARAGKYGTGFSAVTKEVRNLAKLSSASASNITTLIENVVTQIEGAVTAANTVDTDMNSILEASNNVNDMLNNVSTTMNQHSSNLKTINTSINEMEKVTAENATSAEQISVTVKEVARQSSGVNERIKTFTLVDTSS